MPQTYGGAGSKQADLCRGAGSNEQTYAPPMAPLPLPALQSMSSLSVTSLMQEEPNPKSRKFILHKHIHHLSCHVSSYVSQKELCTSMHVPAHMHIAHTKDTSGRVSSGYCRGEMQGEMQYLQVLPGCGHFLASSFLALFVLPFVCLHRDQEEG